MNLQVWGSEWKEPLGRLDGDRDGAGEDPARLGPPGLRPRRRPARRQEGAPARARRAGRPVRRAAHADPARGVHLDGRDAGRLRQRAGEDHRRRAGRRGGLRARPRAHRAREGAPVALRARPAPARHDPGAPRRRAPSSGSSAARCETGYDREYEQEPPTDTPPALVPTLLRQGGERRLVRVHGDALRPDPARRLHVDARDDRAADLGRPAAARASPTSSSRPGRPTSALTPWERAVADVVDGVIADGPRAALALPRPDRGRPDDDEQALHRRSRRTSATEVGNRRWLISQGRAAARARLARLRRDRRALLIYSAAHGWRSRLPALERRRARSASAWRRFVNAALARRRPHASASSGAAARATARSRPSAGTAFRRYLTDFPRLQEAPPATLALWERLLVYGIAFGIADRVLQAAHWRCPRSSPQASSIYWISPGGELGGGASSMAIGDLASGFGSALAPPSSGSGGGGGGFSGAAAAAAGAAAAGAW